MGVPTLIKPESAKSEFRLIHGSEKRQIYIQKVYEVQDLGRSFLSVSKMNDRGFEVQFLNNNADVIDEKKKVHIRADSVGNLYHVILNQQYSNNVEWTWSQDFDKNNLVYGLTSGVDEKLSECEVYLRQNWLLNQFLNLVKVAQSIFRGTDVALWGTSRLVRKIILLLLMTINLVGVKFILQLTKATFWSI